MKISVLGVLVFTLMLMVFFSGCGGSPADAVVGTWVSVEHYVGDARAPHLEGRKIGFEDDGTAIITGMGSGTYVVEDDTIIFTSERGEEVKYEIVDDQLIVETLAVKIIYETAD